MTKGFVHRRGERDRPTPPADVDIDEMRRFACQVIVKGGLLDAAALQGIDDGSHLGREQDQIAH